MDYRQTIAWLYEQLPMYQRIGKAAYKADLKNTEAILLALGNPERKITAIHIAGTNGKGSVSHMIASILQEAGYKTGLYTSPHLKDFRERVKLNGDPIPENKVVEFISKNKDTFLNISSSFFEMTVGLAFDYFAEEEVDYAVIETGLGGRLDSTNLCQPILSIITNIGIDHCAFLGNTVQEIASEKAGIIKNKIPVIVGKHQALTDAVFITKANESNAPIQFAEDVIDLRQYQTEDNSNKLFDVWLNNKSYINSLKSPLNGNYQHENICTAIASIETLIENNQLDISIDNIISGMENVIQNTGFFGRWQKLSSNPLTICDTGHNIDGMKSIVRQLGEMKYKQLHFVLGMVSDKDIFEILTILPKNATYYFCKPDIPRGMNEEELAQAGFKAGINGLSYNSVTQAFRSAINNAGNNDLIFIGGSTFVVAEVI